MKTEEALTENNTWPNIREVGWRGEVEVEVNAILLKAGTESMVAIIIMQECRLSRGRKSSTGEGRGRLQRAIDSFITRAMGDLTS